MNEACDGVVDGGVGAEGEWRVMGVEERVGEGSSERIEEAWDGGVGVDGIVGDWRVMAGEERGGVEAVEMMDEVCGSEEGEVGGEAEGVEKEVVRGEKREKEKGEWGDGGGSRLVLICRPRCARVEGREGGLGVPVWRDEREECWWWSGPGEWLSWPAFPGSLLCDQ